jgi:hypothetical protein
MADSKPGVHVLQLKHVSVPPSMIAGEKFIKWDEVDNYIYFEIHMLIFIRRILHWSQL